MLKSVPEVSDLTKRDFFHLNLSNINRKLGKKFRRFGLDSVSDPLKR